MWAISKSVRGERILKVFKSVVKKKAKMFGTSKAIVVNRHQTGLGSCSV